jgi:uncharacterized membrane protein
MYEWLLLLHLVSAMLWLGATAVLAALATLLVRRSDPVGVARLTGSLRTIGPLMLAPAPVAVIAAGVLLVYDSSAWNAKQAWVWIGIGCFALAFAIGAVHQSRTAIAAHRAAESGDDGEASQMLRRWGFGGWSIVVVLVVATWDMVFKPGL